MEALPANPPKKRRRVRKLIGFVAVAALIAWLSVTPNNFLFRLVRSPITGTDTNVITGPYPEESDFKLLKSHSVENIVCLLNP